MQPIIFTPPTGDLGSPLGFPPLFEQRDVGGGLRPIGDIFINRGELAPSYIAQVFSTDAAGDGSGQGFLGFGGGDGGVFGSSTISTLFNHDSGTENESMNAFGNSSMQGAMFPKVCAGCSAHRPWASNCNTSRTLSSVRSTAWQWLCNRWV
ncbi:hypothetical protein QZH47_20530 [Pseudomonas corrugata]